ncbi:hypothetical protein GYMLUDRAFT_897974 [Collybiopsis luxurians FD-317 M1]|uniref:Uncharacterized protein n=1 Tax=Collybiopsis luxurians FD-317 M1 TaxID=944289 RepID=A0A0D0BXV2_9AGAR|nr:hypothetical protein GYMLUDRAFT_897974 [Collybiopsis luxurians FD-317 M1]
MTMSSQSPLYDPSRRSSQYSDHRAERSHLSYLSSSSDSESEISRTSSRRRFVDRPGAGVSFSSSRASSHTTVNGGTISAIGRDQHTNQQTHNTYSIYSYHSYDDNTNARRSRDTSNRMARLPSQAAVSFGSARASSHTTVNDGTISAVGRDQHTNQQTHNSYSIYSYHSYHDNANARRSRDASNGMAHLLCWCRCWCGVHIVSLSLPDS